MTNTSIELLKIYDKAYTDGNPMITDTEYDIFRESVRKEYPNHVYFTTVGASTGREKKINLPFILGSLDKVKTDSVEKWIEGKGNLVASYKLDGVSFMCTWEDGKVVFASTRGDGTIGQDITKKIQLIVHDIPISYRVSLRGELLLTGNDHMKLNFKNRRNGVAGIVNKPNASLDSINSLYPVFYEVLDGDNDFNTEQERLQFIKSLNLNVVPWQVIPSNRDIIKTLSQMIIESKKQNYDIDGIVLSQNISKRENVMYPTNKIAYKVNTEAIKVTVKKIEWNLGRTGKVTPLIHIEPVELDGVTVSKATGFNRDFIATNGVGAGSEVGLVRSGGVIPYITEVFKSVDPVLPTECPSCGGNLRYIGVDLVCNNKDCYDSKVRQIAYFFKTMGSDYITETTIRNLNVNSIEEMYELDELEIAEIEGFGIKKAEQIYYEIQKTLTVMPENLLAAFGISGIGKTLSGPILEKYKFDDLFVIDSIEDIDGVGSILSDNLVNNINKFASLYNFLLEKNLKFIKKEKSMISGKIFTLTGKMPMKRDDIIKLIISKGGNVKDISKGTNYLVTDDTSSGSNKNLKAKQLGTSIIDFNTLLSMIKS